MDQSRYLITGDVVYGENRFGIYRYVINRTTKTLAISDNNVRFKVKVHHDGTVDLYGDQGESWKVKSHMVENPQIKEAYEYQEISSFLKSFDFRKLRIETLRAIQSVVKGDLVTVDIINKIYKSKS